MARRRSSARSSRVQADNSGNNSTLITSFPAYVNTCLRRLPDQAERFLSYGGRLSPTARRVAESLSQDIGTVFGHLEALRASATSADSTETGAAVDVSAVLSHGPVRVSLLRLIAVGARLPPEEYQPDAQAQLSRALCFVRARALAGGLLDQASSVSCPRNVPIPAIDFARSLLRMQTLQALSRQLAAATALLLAAPAPPNPSLQQQHALLIIRWRAALVVENACRFTCALTTLAALPLTGTVRPTTHRQHQQQLSPPQDEAAIVAYSHYVTELVAALQDSCVLEHAARLLLLLIEIAPELNDLPGASVHLKKILLNLLWLRVTESLDPVGATPVAQLHEVLSGCCLRHAALVIGLAVLCKVDGGSSYGLPLELLRGVPVITPHSSAPEASGRCLRIVDDGTFINMLRLLHPQSWRPPPGRRTVLEVAHRIGSFAVASGQVWAGVACPLDGRHARGSARRFRAEVSGGGAGAAAAAAEAAFPSAAPSDPWAVLPLQDVPEVATEALRVASHHLRPLQPDSAPQSVEEVVQWWRLAESVVRHAVRGARRGVSEQLAAEMSERLARGARLPCSLAEGPSPEVAAALAGGFLPCLERLLRRAGEEPTSSSSGSSSPEAALLCGLLDARTQGCLVSLLVYGQERQAAALAVTIGKLLRGTELGVVTTEAGTEAPSALASVQRRVAHAAWGFLEFAADALRRAARQGEDALLAAAAASAPFRQMGVMASIALCEWLPPLSRLVRQAAREVAVAAGVSSASAAAGSAAAGGLETMTQYVAGCLSWWLLPMMHKRASSFDHVDKEEEDGGGTGGTTGGGASSSSGATAAGAGRSGIDAAAGSGGVASASTSQGVKAVAASSSSDPDAYGCGGWFQLMLGDVEVVALLGAALQLGARGPRERGWLIASCCNAASRFTRQVQEAAVATAAAGRHRSGWHYETVCGLRPTGSGSRRMQRELAAERAAAEALAAQLDSWTAETRAKHAWNGGDDCDVDVVDHESPSMQRLHAAGRATMSLEVRGAAALLVSPAELRVRGLVRGCGNPGCTNLAGDSEAEVKLKACGRCGAVGYCCRECQVAHWRAGHKEACGRGHGVG
ncbi:hypothetical protein Agub_g6100 [Astrephomene gubernaculifera]|uniref:phytol kinase n=1 Tax=Astrephomene gubernaculifera TaxID=47775 RepID=A0AAD3DPA9_9CHLO|nr:hypothetical protein Agub_g6100 [Astrephomene gubernaculifera]